VTTLKAEKEDLEASLAKKQMLTIQLKQDLVEAEAKNTELTRVSFLLCQLDAV
jgi:hypothetical protein